MPLKDETIVNKIATRNSIFFVLAAILIFGIILLIEDKTHSLILTFIIMVFYFILYNLSKSELIRGLNQIIGDEYKDFHKTYAKVIALNERQRQLTDKYIEVLEDVVQTTKLFKNNVIKSKEKTQNVSKTVQEVYESSGKELKSLNENIVSMQNLKQKVQVIAELVIELTDYVKQIGSTVSIVENISEQTNMLALNAAVEAARAGEYGKGFSVVASEIRKLADESKQATTRITTLVSEIEQTTSSTIVATEDGAREIETDVKFADDINNNFSVIINNIKNLNNELNDIITDSIEQQSVTNEILESIENMKGGISESISNIEENIKVLSEMSINIKDNVVN